MGHDVAIWLERDAYGRGQIVWRLPSAPTSEAATAAATAKPPATDALTIEAVGGALPRDIYRREILTRDAARYHRGNPWLYSGYEDGRFGPG